MTPPMRTATILKQVYRFDVRSYVEQVRADGRAGLGAEERRRMAELYEDLTGLRERLDELTAPERAIARFAEIFFHAEWKLAVPSETPDQLVTRGGTPLDRRGKRYQPYANIRLLNDVLGTRRHAADRTVERRARQVVHRILTTWADFEEQTVSGRVIWAGHDVPAADVLAERIERLRRLGHRAAGVMPGLPPAGSQPPCDFECYLPPHGDGNTIEYLTALPQTTLHDEVTFLRTIHIVEATTWAILARVMAAAEWLRTRHWAFGERCLRRAADLAALQAETLVAMRRTLSVDRFLAFREATGDASAVQSLPAQLLLIHLFGIHPEKTEALAEATENNYLLLYLNPGFLPLRSLLQEAARAGDAGRTVLDAAHSLDTELFKWRRVHYGAAVRYLPPTGGGSGGTTGAPYLRGFYRDRLFDDDRVLLPQPPPSPPQHLDPSVRARPAFSAAN
ncbi:hypothetical protein [Streptomyces bauhiniae]|uniref:hypothetical protein n=1 Tax=Streptomyces bauhiniae TaxID=2340725 RepID=UPI0035E2F144